VRGEAKQVSTVLYRSACPATIVATRIMIENTGSFRDFDIATIAAGPSRGGPFKPHSGSKRGGDTMPANGERHAPFNK